MRKRFAGDGIAQTASIDGSNLQTMLFEPVIEDPVRDFICIAPAEMDIDTTVATF